MNDNVLSHNLKAQSVWNAPGGRYDSISRSIADAIEHAVERLQPRSGEQAWQLWLNHYGPAKSLAASLDDARRDEFRRAMIAWHETFPSTLGYEQPRQYVVTRGVRK